MNRKEFFTKACKSGICACAGVSLLSSTPLSAQENEKKNCPDDWKIGFMQKRFAKLIDSMEEKLTPEQKDQLLEDMGQMCSAQSNEKWKSYNGNIEKLAADMEKEWAEKVTYDKQNQTITIVGRKTDICFCPFAGGKNISKGFCNCTKGWQKNTLETISGKKAEVTINSSVLFGGDRCSFTVKLS
jgi:hypothetical protein